MKIKVTLFCINKGQPGQFYGLKDVVENGVIDCAPNNWKTKRGAIRWAERNGYEYVE